MYSSMFSLTNVYGKLYKQMQRYIYSKFMFEGFKIVSPKRDTLLFNLLSGIELMSIWNVDFTEWYKLKDCPIHIQSRCYCIKVNC